MNHTRLPLIGLVLGALLVAAASPPAAVTHPATREVIGYFPSWKSTTPGGDPRRIPFSSLTIINYAFFVPQPDGSLAGKDSAGDVRYLSSKSGESLIALAHRHSVKVVLSIGGWTDSDNFPLVASTPGLRAAFARSCVAAIKRHGFDGIDIDWEFPGFQEHMGTPGDTKNCTLLFTTLRDSLSALTQQTGSTYLLTAALPAGIAHARDMEIAKLIPLLDMFNLMTYDFYGTWDPLANHNSPLYPSAGSDTTYCVDWAVRLYRDTYRVPADRINIGIASYGHAFAKCAGLHETHSGADTVHFPDDGASYAAITALATPETRRWDDRACVPYLVDTARQMVVSFDDEQSVELKGKYAVQHALRGAIVWEITDDAIPGGRNPLLERLGATVLGRSFHDHE